MMKDTTASRSTLVVRGLQKSYGKRLVVRGYAIMGGVEVRN
mgnify:CR=1 FL=1